jgi:hypothetical protein
VLKLVHPSRGRIPEKQEAQNEFGMDLLSLNRRETKCLSNDIEVNSMILLDKGSQFVFQAS